MWPSIPLSDMAIERLMAHDHPFPYEHLRYEGAGHMITLPNSEPPPSWASRYEVGGTREANEFANEDSCTKVLGFLEKYLRRRSLNCSESAKSVYFLGQVRLALTKDSGSKMNRTK